MTTIKTSTLRPGLLVSLKSSVRGNCRYFKPEIGETKIEQDGAAISRWTTERTIADPKEYEAAKAARSKACGLVRKVCRQSAFGLLCPEVDEEKLVAAIREARKVIDEFNAGAAVTQVDIFVLPGRVSPDEVEAVRAINSEIRELMAEMAGGIETGNVDEIREAATRVKNIGEMLATDAQTKVEMAVKTARDAAKQIVRDREREGSQGTASVDQSAVRRITELRTAFLDLDDDEAAVSAPKAGKTGALDIAAE